MLFSVTFTFEFYINSSAFGVCTGGVDLKIYPMPQENIPAPWSLGHYLSKPWRGCRQENFHIRLAEIATFLTQINPQNPGRAHNRTPNHPIQSAQNKWHLLCLIHSVVPKNMHVNTFSQ